MEKAVLSHLITSYISIFFHSLTMMSDIIRHSRSIFCPGFLISQVWNVCFWVVVMKNVRVLSDHGTLKSAVSQEIELIK